jgi:hypothetical protein
MKYPGELYPRIEPKILTLALSGHVVFRRPTQRDPQWLDLCGSSTGGLSLK